MKHCNLVVLDTLKPLPESVTLCATVDESGHEQVITELMIRHACEQMEDDQIWPMLGANVALVAEQASKSATAQIPTAQILEFRPRA